MYAADTGWQTSPQLATASISTRFQIAMGSNGSRIAMWEQPGSNNTNSIWVSQYKPITGWITPQEISQGINVTNLTLWALLVNPDDTAIAVWFGVDENGASHLYENHLSTTGWSPAVPFETFNGPISGSSPQATLSYVSIGGDASGNALLVYGCSKFTSADSNGVFAKRYVAGSGWQATTKLPGTTAADVIPMVSTAPSGSAIVVWSENTTRQYASHFSLATGWEMPVPIDNDIATRPVPSISTSADGTTFVMWSQCSGPNCSIQSNRYVPGQGWSGVSTITSNSGGPGFAGYSLATDGNGNAAAIWASGSKIYVSRYR
jgi:hypothetical protein